MVVLLVQIPLLGSPRPFLLYSPCAACLRGDYRPKKRPPKTGEGQPGLTPKTSLFALPEPACYPPKKLSEFLPESAFESPPSGRGTRKLDIHGRFALQYDLAILNHRARLWGAPVDTVGNALRGVPWPYVAFRAPWRSVLRDREIGSCSAERHGGRSLQPCPGIAHCDLVGYASVYRLSESAEP